jgi:transcriptional regulator with XRE-family HTH domain
LTAMHIDPVKLERLREQGGYSRRQLADKVGMSAEAIRKIEVGETKYPHLLTVKALAEALGIPLQELAVPDGEEGAA